MDGDLTPQGGTGHRVGAHHPEFGGLATGVQKTLDSWKTLGIRHHELGGIAGLDGEAVGR